MLLTKFGDYLCDVHDPHSLLICEIRNLS